jgi:hypothetical protein
MESGRSFLTYLRYVDNVLEYTVNLTRTVPIVSIATGMSALNLPHASIMLNGHLASIKNLCQEEATSEGRANMLG